MVKITKWILLGVGLLAVSFFFKEAAASSLTKTLGRTGLAGQQLGAGIAATGAGVGQAGVSLLNPFWSLADLIKRYGSLFNGTSSTTVTSTTQPAINTTGGVSSGQPVTGTDVTNNKIEDSGSWSLFPEAFAENEINVGGSNIQHSIINWGSGASYQGPLSEEARNYYSSLGYPANVLGHDPRLDDSNGGGTNNSTGGGGGHVGAHGGYAGGSIAASVGNTVSWGG